MVQGTESLLGWPNAHLRPSGAKHATAPGYSLLLHVRAIYVGSSSASIVMVRASPRKRFGNISAALHHRQITDDAETRAYVVRS